jgi:hypothetical protein
MKKDKTLEDINLDIQTSMISGGKNDREVQMKIKETHLINNLKKELKELQNISKNKTIEIEKMKKSIKTVKINDMNQEILNLTDEIMKVKSRYEVSMKENIEKEALMKEYKHLQEFFGQRQGQLFQVSEEVKSLELTARLKDEEINNFKNFIKEKENYISKVIKKLKIQKQINEKKTKEFKVVDVNQVKQKISECEAKIPDLQSELSTFKKDSE